MDPATPPSLALKQRNGPVPPPCGQREDGTVNSQRLCSGSTRFNNSLRLLVCISPSR